MQRAQGAAEGRVDQVQRGPDRDHQQRGNDPVPLLVARQFEAEQAHRRHRHAVRPARPLRFVTQRNVDDDAQTQRRHRQIVALELEDRAGDQRRQNAGGQRTGAHGQQRMPAEMRRQHGRRVGADAEEAGMAKADLAGKADQQVEAEDDDGVDRHADRQIGVVTVGRNEGHDGQDQRNDEDAFGGRLHDYTRSVDLPPNRPRGMKKRMKRMSTKGIASL